VLGTAKCGTSSTTNGGTREAPPREISGFAQIGFLKQWIMGYGGIRKHLWGYMGIFHEYIS
jgi:hypothetical protein